MTVAERSRRVRTHLPNCRASPPQSWVIIVGGRAGRGNCAKPSGCGHDVLRGQNGSEAEVEVAGRTPDRSFRSLSGLEKTASTSRVLNLAAVASQNAGDPDYEK